MASVGAAVAAASSSLKLLNRKGDVIFTRCQPCSQIIGFTGSHLPFLTNASGAAEACGAKPPEDTVTLKGLDSHRLLNKYAPGEMKMCSPGANACNFKGKEIHKSNHIYTVYMLRVYGRGGWGYCMVGRMCYLGRDKEGFFFQRNISSRQFLHDLNPKLALGN